MKWSSLFALLVVVASCAKKTANQQISATLLDQVCAIEIERHGEQPDVPVREFGNEFMDRYLETAKSDATLWQAFKDSKNVCRGAFLQLYFDAFPQKIQSRWLSEKDTFTRDDRIRLGYLVYSREKAEMQALVMEMLANAPEPDVRESAALALSILPQEKLAKRIAAVIEKETNAEVLTAIVLALEFDKDAQVATLIGPLLETEHLGVAQALITTIATSELVEKRTYLNQLAQSNHSEIAQSAEAALANLDAKPKLGLKLTGIHTSVPGTRPYNRRLQFQLLEALHAERFSIAETLLSKGARLDMGRTPKSTMLHEILDWDGSEASVRWVLDRGIDLEAKDSSGMTAFMAAAVSGWPERQVDQLAILVAAGADLNATNGIGETALHIAARLNRLECVKALLRLGADPNLRDTTGRTPANMAALLGHDQIAALLGKLK